MNLTKLEFKKIFTPLTVIAVVVMLLLNLYMTIDYRAYYLLEALDPDSKSKPIETLKSEYAEKRGEITENLHESCLCRTQIKLKLDDFSYFLTNPINNHHLVCCGDYTDALNEFFALIG